MNFADQFKDVTVGSLTKKIKKKGYWIVCMECGRTVSKVNKDGECEKCARETKQYRDQTKMFGY